MYCYNGNDIIFFHLITGERITDWKCVSQYPGYDEDWNMDAYFWHFRAITDMAQEFHDSKQLEQLPNNLKEFILESKRVGFGARKYSAEILEQELPVYEKYTFGDLENPPNQPEIINQAWEELLDYECDNDIESELMWNEIQINGYNSIKETYETRYWGNDVSKN